MAPITHIVIFQFAATASSEQIKDVCQRMHALPQTCKHPETGEPYAQGLGGGKDNSPEGKNGGFTHAFVMQFKTHADRHYYLNQDPTHLAFVESLAGVVEDARIVDFVDGVF
ncbi:hypothetical protein MBLNU230_g1245t1 [Neophaeotheca triangularis]